MCTNNLRFSRFLNTVNPVLSGHSKIDKTNILMTNGSLMEVENIAEYFRSALNDNWS